MALGKFRHKVTGKVVELDTRYASAISAFEPADSDARVDNLDPCCGAGAEEDLDWGDEDVDQELVSAGVDTLDWPADDEPTDTNEGE